MSLSGLFQTGLTAINTNKMALDITGNNIANVNTAEYSRQDVVLSLSSPVQQGGFQIGQGVQVMDILRRFDQITNTQLLIQHQTVGYATVLNDNYSYVEENFNEQKQMGIGTQMREFFNSLEELAGEPDGATQRSVVLTKAYNLLSMAKGIERRLTDAQTSINQAIDPVISRINSLAETIRSYNNTIAETEAGGLSKANDVRDQRDGALNQLADLVDFSTLEDSSGRITVMVGQRNLVSGGTATHPLSRSRNADGKSVIRADYIDITSLITGGQLGGLLKMANNEQSGIPAILGQLRQAVGGIMNEMNMIHSSGVGLNPATFTASDFTPAQTTSVNIQNISVNALTSPLSAAGLFTDFTTRVADQSAVIPGQYRINFTGTTANGGITYDVYRNERGDSATASGDTPVSQGVFNPTKEQSITVNGTELTFTTQPQVGQDMYMSNNTPGDYKIEFPWTSDPTRYKVYKNGQEINNNGQPFSPANPANPNDPNDPSRFPALNANNIININGMSVQLSGAPNPSAGLNGKDVFYVSAPVKNLFTPLSVNVFDKTDTTAVTTASILSATIYDRSAVTYKKYEINFTGATTYKVLDVRSGASTTGTLTAANDLLLDGMKISFGTNPAPTSGDTYVISPSETAIFTGQVNISDLNDVAAASASVVAMRAVKTTGASETVAGQPGNNENALSMNSLSKSNITNLGNVTLESFYQNTVTWVGSLSRDAIDKRTFEESLLKDVKLRRDSLSGVSLDEEAANLIRFQKGFEAAARLVTTADTLLSIIINLGQR